MNLREINRTQFRVAKRYWAAAVVLKLLIFVFGAYAIFLATPPKSLPQMVLVVAIASELLQLRSDAVKSRAERLLRTLDLCRSFGREISAADKRDIVAGVSSKLRRQFEASPADTYFDSQGIVGPRAAVANLLESAWYTRRQTTVMAVIYGVLISVLFVTALTALTLAARDILDVSTRERIVRLVTAWLLLVVSLNMFKSVWSYLRMKDRCQRTELACEHLMRSEVSEADALRQWYEYQLARASSPMLPEWLWKVMGRRLDEEWNAAKSDS